MSDTSIGSFNTEDSLAQMNQGGGRDRWLTPRSIGLSLILVGVFAYFLPHLYLKWSLRVHAGGYLPVIAVFPFLILMALNALVRRVGLGLSRGEITVVFCAMMVSLSTLLTIMMLFTILPAPVRGATPGNKFEQLFLWSADSRILPYTMEDKEREKTASQFQESLNWYYMGVPKPPAKEVELRYDPGQAWWLSTRAAVGAVAPLSPAPQATTTRIELEVPPLQTPWWRWIRKHAVDRDARMRAYEALADQIQRTEGLDPALAKEMLAEVAVLRTNVGWIQSPDALVYDKIPFHGTYGTMLRRLGESKTLGPIAWRELRLAVEHQQDIDVEWPWWRWGDSHGLERVAGYEALAGKVRQAKGLEPEIAAAMLAEVDTLKDSVTRLEIPRKLTYREMPHQTAYRALLERLSQAKGLSAAGLRDLREAVAREQKTDLEVSQYGWPNAFGLERLSAYETLGAKIKKDKSLDPQIAEELGECVGRLEAALADGGTPVEAYADLLGALRKEEALRGVLWRDLVEAIEREREIDLAVPWWRWGRARGEERVRAYDALKARIGRLRNDRYGEIKKLSPKTALAMYDQVETLKKDVRTISGPGAAYARLGKLLCEGRGVGGDARETLTAAIDRERGTDWHIGTHLEVPPERRTVDQPWYGWTGPLVWWLVLLTLFVILQFCLAALLRRQWVDHEKLLFPHVEMLEAVTEPGPSGAPGGGILRNRLFWVGFIFAVLLFAIEGVHHYWPKVPGFDLKEISLKPLLTKRPWTAIPAGLDLHLFVIAITFLLPSEISLSLWVFVLLDMMVKLYLVATGETHHVHEPICGYLTNGGTDQVAGMTVFMLVLMYAARRHFRGVLRKAFGGGKDIDDSEEPLPYFGAFWGLVLSAVGILLWCYIMGMSPFLSVILFGLTIIAVMFLARIVCELGIVTGSYQEPTMPQYLTAGTFGYRTQVGRMTLWNRLMFMTPTYTTWAFLWGPLFYGTHVMPMTMTSERMFRHGQSRRRFTFFLMLLTVAVMIVFAVRAIGIPYEEGAMRQKQGFHNRSGHMFGNCLARDFIRKEAMHKPFKPMYGGAISGVVIMSVLLTLRHLFYWWPVHPIGYICAGLSGGVWFSVFLGWLIKRGVLKYGGGKLFRTTIPLFVGLLVGHFVMGGIWLIAGAWAEALKQEGVYTAIWAQPYGR